MPVELRGEHEVYSTTLGRGPRKGLLLHCSLGHHGAWRGVAQLLGEGFTFTTYDHLEHGKSAWWDRADDFHTANTRVGASFLGDEPLDVVGHSFGATVALRLALDAPEKVRSLVLIEPVFLAVARADDPAYEARHLDEVRQIRAATEAGDRVGAAKAFIDEWGGMPWEFVPEAMKADMAKRIHVIADAGEPLFDDRAEMMARLGRLTMPVMLLRGDQSPKDIATINDGLARRIPHAENRVIEGAGHMLPISHPALCAEALKAFWRLG